MPVEGPARWMSTTTSGSSIATANPIVSAFRSMPGPLVAVTPRRPENAAPRAMLAAAISSSAWIVCTPKRRWRDSAWRSSDAGVIGYEARNSWSPDCTDAAIRPSASAWVPFTFRYVPGGAGAGSTS